MGNISSRQATNLIDGFVLRIARTVDAVLRTINRKLSLLSSYVFSRVFGYDVVISDTHTPLGGNHALSRQDSIVCGPGNVCIVPASRVQQRQLEKKRRSERRKRAEAAALGEKLLHKHHGYRKVEGATPPSSPVSEAERERERVMQSLGRVATAPAPRPEAERETVGERERGKLWVMGNVQPTVHARGQKVSPPASPASATGVGEKMIDQHVLRRMHDQRSSLTAEAVVIKRRIQPRKSSKHAQKLVRATQQSNAATAAPGGDAIQPVVEADETAADRTAADGVHAVSRKEVALHAPRPRVLPPGALSLGPSAWEPAFRHPFSADHERVPTTNPRHLPHSRPKLSLDTHLEASPLPSASTAAFLASPTSDDPPTFAAPAPPLSRPPSAASHHTRSRTPASVARKSIDAISLRSSFDASPSSPAAAAIDVKMLATQAVKEEKGRKVWKDQVNKAAMQRCLLQQNHALPLTAAGAGAGGRRFSTATLAADRALTRVRTQEGDARAPVLHQGRRGSSPALNAGFAGVGGMTSGRSTPILRAESPLHSVAR
ncbi:hypothetical protein EX895_005031 [Sporisorium graminicola]|uniref:Uncharacterized protein n=1 Tax=Sporisorium graminicola TaxID=280036 RepID=A0A4U7KQE1_9BASI|nr:hypothetical protein EX895_005031 [Sporisorium graminicola]TKY86206.1 hypothetical protein EX895_005031 [Sporisorium graminicola]